jgi:hypothetical protein
VRRLSSDRYAPSARRRQPLVLVLGATWRLGILAWSRRRIAGHWAVFFHGASDRCQLCRNVVRVVRAEDWAKGIGAVSSRVGVVTGINPTQIHSFYERLGYELRGILFEKGPVRLTPVKSSPPRFTIKLNTVSITGEVRLADLVASDIVALLLLLKFLTDGAASSTCWRIVAAKYLRDPRPGG